MKSSNPVLTGRGFTEGGAAAARPRDLTADQLEAAYARPSAGSARTGRMTIGDVVSRTSATLGVVVAGVLLGWFALPERYGLAVGAAVVAFVLAMVQAFRRTPSPALVLGYALFEGVFLGVLSRTYNEEWQGAPVQAVLGTAAVFCGMLLAYRTRLIRVTTRYRRIGLAVCVAFLIAIVVNLVFSAFGGGDTLGIRTGGLGIAFCVLGILLGAFFLSLDFQQVEEGVRDGVPQQHAWLAAFGLTLSLVWIYLELLRLVALLRD